MPGCRPVALDLRGEAVAVDLEHRLAVDRAIADVRVQRLELRQVDLGTATGFQQDSLCFELPFMLNGEGTRPGSSSRRYAAAAAYLLLNETAAR